MMHLVKDIPCNILALVRERPEIPNNFVDLRYFETVELQ